MTADSGGSSSARSRFMWLKKHKAVAAGIVFVVVMWAGTPWFLEWLEIGDREDRGQFGDMYGAVNALFTGAALLGAIYAIRLQTEELGLQREEMKNSTAEFRIQNAILSSQLETARAAQSAAETKERLASMPFVRHVTGPSESVYSYMELQNIGADTYDVGFTSPSGVVCTDINAANRDRWRTGETIAVQFHRLGGAELRGEKWEFHVNFTTKMGATGSTRFEVDEMFHPTRKETQLTG